MSQKIAIIAGAGPAGLTAAYELLKRTDITPVVFESTDAIGGIAQTFNYKGNRIDIGGHRFFSKSERVMDWWFNILPRQGAPAADTAEKKHEIDYAAEAVIKYLCPECIESPESFTTQDSQLKTVTRKAPDPEKEDQVMLQRPRLSRIYYNALISSLGITPKTV
jgi:protoporphyrinogen oxidase